MIDRALALPVEERRWVIATLLDSLLEPEDTEVHPAWAEEIARRIEQVEHEGVRSEPWSEVRARMRQAIGR